MICRSKNWSINMTLYKSMVKKVSVSPDKKTKQKDYLQKGSLPIVDQGQELVGGYTDDMNMVVKCNLPVIVFGDHTRAVKYIDFPFGAGADGIKVLQPKEGVFPKYLYYATQYLVLRLEDRGYARHYQYIEKKEIDVPNYKEQERIVARIEELFSQLDSGVETLKKTKEQLAVYRQAVLKEAFDVTKEFVPFGKITESRLGKMLDKEKNTGILQTYLRNINVRWFSFDLSDLLEMRIEPTETEKYSIEKGDLVICEGGEPGRCAVWEQDEAIFYQKALHRVRFINEANPKFYMYYLWFAAQTGRLNPYFTGMGIKHLTGQSLVKVPVPNANNEQQNLIVQDIESKLSVCDSIEKTVDTALQQAEAMRQSILKKAFEGCI